MQSAVVCVSIYMPLFYQRVSADCTRCAPLAGSPFLSELGS